MSLLMQPRVLIIGVLRVFFLVTFVSLIFSEAAIAQLGERQTEDLKVPGSIPGLGRRRVRKLVRGCGSSEDVTCVDTYHQMPELAP